VVSMWKNGGGSVDRHEGIRAIMKTSLLQIKMSMETIARLGEKGPHIIYIFPSLKSQTITSYLST
jgi:hypothetical protein